MNAASALTEYAISSAWKTDGSFTCDNERFNKNYDMVGHIVEWYYNGIAGIQPQEPGFSRIIIRPYLPESMNSFTCSYNSVRGKITVSVNREDDTIKLEYTVPDGIECEVVTDDLQESAKRN